MNTHFHTSTLPPQTATLVSQLQDNPPLFLDTFYLSGGTALSIQLNHRESEDLDFFSKESFDPLKLQPQLEAFGKLGSLELAEDTLNAYLNNVKVQFLGYPYSLLKGTVDWHGIKVSSVLDVACTKLQTIGMRGSKKDFIDLFFIMKKYLLHDLFVQLDKKYQDADFNRIHILKSLVYFEDAESQPMPRMHHNISWEEIKKDITNKVNTLKL